MIINLALIPIEKAMNAYVALDQDTVIELKKLSNKTIKIVITDWNLTFFCTLRDGEFKLSIDHGGPVDATLSGTLFGLLRTGLAKGETSVAFKNKIDITGDTHLAQSIQAILKQIDIDWEEHLSKCTGDALAFSIGKTIKKASRILRHSADSIKESTQEYLHEEIDIAPTKNEINALYKDIRHTRDAVERLEARIKMIEAKNKS
jgi:ubiquinone biosynthesis accessory factor UbiJ